MKLHLDVLPIHPQPLPLESYTGYLTRLGEVNGIRRLNQLSVVTGLHLAEVRSPSDFPHVATYARLPQVTMSSTERLQATTFYYLLRKFGRTTSAPNMSKHFLQESIGSHLRYCPLCLAEYGYISLLWRFLGVEACVQHGVDLLTECGHCGQPMPFLPNGLRVAHCPHCQKDLRICKTCQASETAMQRTRIWRDDLAFLLTPQSWDDCNVIQHVGPQLLRRRHQHQYSLDDTAAYLGVTANTIQGMESQVKARKGEHFIHYMRYGHWLGFSMRQLFTQAATAYHKTDVDCWIVLDIREQSLLERLNLATEQLVDAQFPSFKWFAEQLGVSTGRLQQYPRIVARVKQLQARHREREKQHYEDLLARSYQAAQYLAALGQPVTRQALSEAVGIGYAWFTKHHEFAALLQAYDAQREACHDLREQALYNQVEAAIQHLQTSDQRITISAVAIYLGMDDGSLRNRHRLDALFVQAGVHSTSYLENKRLAEDVLMQQLPTIEAQLLTDGLSLTQGNVIAVLGISKAKAFTYPRLDGWLRQLPNRQQQRRIDQDTEFSERLLNMLKGLQETRKLVTVSEIATEFDCPSSAYLRSLPKTWQMISAFLREQEAAQKQRFYEKEQDYLLQIETILHDLQQSGDAISAQIVCERLGVPRNSLRSYFQVRARLQQLAEDTRRQNR